MTKIASTAAPGSARRRRPGYDGESILAVAVEVFNRHGYEGTSMGLLAEYLGISKAGIYYHVPSKEDLPVSYTHLDVYKRQGRWCGSRSRRARRFR